MEGFAEEGTEGRDAGSDYDDILLDARARILEIGSQMVCAWDGTYRPQLTNGTTFQTVDVSNVYLCLANLRSLTRIRLIRKQM